MILSGLKTSSKTTEISQAWWRMPLTEADESLLSLRPP